MKLNRTVILTDGRRLSATIIIADLVTFERQYDADAPLTSQRIEHCLFLAWAALKRQGDVDGEFDDFLPLVEDFESTDEPAPPVPKGERSKKVSLVS